MFQTESEYALQYQKKLLFLISGVPMPLPASLIAYAVFIFFFNNDYTDCINRAKAHRLGLNTNVQRLTVIRSRYFFNRQPDG